MRSYPRDKKGDNYFDVTRYNQKTWSYPIDEISGKIYSDRGFGIFSAGNDNLVLHLSL